MGTLNARNVAELLAALGVKPNEPLNFTPIPAVVKSRAEGMYILQKALSETKDAAQKLVDDGVVDEHEAAAFRRIFSDEPDLIKRVHRLRLWIARVQEFNNEREINPTRRH